MKKLAALLLSALVLLARPALAQIDTTGGKYYQPLYPGLSIARGVPFGSAVNAQGNPQTLLMDVYRPAAGPATPQPLLILAHGGAFLFGARADYDVSELCTRFARLGYVTVSIDYRLGNFATFGSAAVVVRAVHDMRAAVRFFRQDAATVNQYNVEPDYIFVGGSSAGAITALHAAFLDKDTELTTLNAGVPGGLEGNSGNPGYSSASRAAINLCGALGNPTWLEAGSQPFVSLHGTNDPIVPYGAQPLLSLYGSSVLKPRADAVGVFNAFYSFKGAGHVPYNGTTAAELAYMDTTFRFVRDFLRPLLAAPAAPLPVTLTRFEAGRQGPDARLSWTAATEQNSVGYEVQ
ncbi:MAG: alpha/beta hydrolase, partial [Hymenobacter sp.]|nr:alpha/beta hydrolase [Hymenobacter sp.]